ncbi:DUF6520 family protein [Flavobacterium pectinovorum]|uniref:DUF3551 domain-containing protein n=1 Tax=Flavobacterium pectinovorum TaxID=29533 RepID=A0AB36P7D2_9FLAO|nr:DUF6520 family protein [Flavobacterium pectinovorum]OXB07813.1 hypothetical protein B0A72_02805 [Flavobacterium pectinovorum]SHM81307.1 hypothetical protein SAMN05444387_3266 [Flavobacterium pectinovorum]
MKTRIFKTIFPVMAFMTAIFSAFAFSSVSATEADSLAPVMGHYKVNGICTPKIECQDDTETTACQFEGQNVYRKLSNTSCSSALWRKP